MKIIDLTHTMDQTMPVFPGAEPPMSTVVATLAEDGFVEAKVTLYSHSGTHIDSPAHMLEDGGTLDRLAVEAFVGPGVVVDCTGSRAAAIDVAYLEPYEDDIKAAEFVVLKTGWDAYWGTEGYFSGYPCLTEGAARWLAEIGPKGIGVDAVSVDRSSDTRFPIHKILLGSNILIIENMMNLAMLPAYGFVLSVLPLKLAGAEGAPVRAVAILPKGE